jgi:hypothetical protein
MQNFIPELLADGFLSKFFDNSTLPGISGSPGGEHGIVGGITTGLFRPDTPLLVESKEVK